MAKARKILQVVNCYKDHKFGRILVFTGARQVGKTVFVKQFLPEYRYLSIEDPTKSSQFTTLSAEQWHSLYPKAALDEIQKEPVLVESIKATYDQFDEVRYALLGSSQILLLKKVHESLAGRCIIIDMYPLTLRELQTNSFDDEVPDSAWQTILRNPTNKYDFLPSFVFHPQMAQIHKWWSYYLQYGGFPALVDDSLTDEERYLWLQNYVRTYLERDIQDLAMLRDLEPFAKLQKALAAQTAQIMNYASVATSIGVSANTVQRYIEYLNVSYQTITLPAWSRNTGKRLVKSPKIHYLDYGVVQAVLGKRGGMTGNEFESCVVSEIYKQTKNLLKQASFYHLRTHDGMEVDLLVELPEGYFAFEIKMAEHVSATDARHLRNLQEFLDKPLLHSFLLSNDNQTHLFSDKITAVSAAYFLG
ncbi:MAG: ATP-binding protein [Bacteroidales bacterium]|nr:ATP-binding protein [Bacteroidales bacterium]